MRLGIRLMQLQTLECPCCGCHPAHEDNPVCAFRVGGDIAYLVVDENATWCPGCGNLRAGDSAAEFSAWLHGKQARIRWESEHHPGERVCVKNYGGSVEAILIRQKRQPEGTWYCRKKLADRWTKLSVVAERSFITGGSP